MTTAIDIIKNAEQTDASALQDTVNSVLSKKAYEKIESKKKEIASSMLNVETEKEQ
jgi:hypothetical protein